VCLKKISVGLTVDSSWVAFKHLWPWSWPWPWIRSYGIPSCISHWPLSYVPNFIHIRKTFLDGLTAGTPPSSRSRDTKTRTSIKNPAQWNKILCSSLRISGHLPAPIVSGVGDRKSAIFGTSEAPWPWRWPWIGSYGIPLCISYRPLSTYQISLKSEKKLFVDVRLYLLTDGHFPSNVIRSTRRSRPKTVTILSCYNFDIHELILTVFERNVTTKVSNQNMIYFPPWGKITSKNYCTLTGARRCRGLQCIAPIAPVLKAALVNSCSFSVRWCSVVALCEILCMLFAKSKVFMLRHVP